MSWMPNWKRQVDSFRLVLGYGGGGPLGPDPLDGCRQRVVVEWNGGEEDEQVALRLQSQLMVALPPPHDVVHVKMRVGQATDVDRPASQAASPRTEAGSQGAARHGFGTAAALAFAAAARPRRKSGGRLPSPRPRSGSQTVEGDSVPEDRVTVELKVSKYREPLRVVCLSRPQISGSPSADSLGLLTRILDPGSLEKVPHITVTEELLGYTQHWRSLAVLSLVNCCLTTVPPEIARLPMLEALYLDNNKISQLPPELGMLTHLKILRADHNQLTTVPIELRQCDALIELSLEHNKLVRPLLDFRALGQLKVLRLFGNPLEFFPEILPCTNLRHLSLANVRIESDEALAQVEVTIASEAPSYFAASKHKLSAFFALIFRYSSVHHPLLASALAKICEDSENRAAIGKDEGAIRQIVSMVLSDSQHVVEQACLALSALASDASVVLRLMKADVLQAICQLLRSKETEILVSVLRVVANIAFSSDEVSARLLSRDTVTLLQDLCTHQHVLVQKEALMALGSLAFCWENRRVLLAAEGLRERLLRLAGGGEAAVAVRRAAARCLAILGENEYLRRAVRGHHVGKHGVRILSMDGGGMRGMSTVQMLAELEKSTGKRVHELFDLICGTSTGGMLAAAIGIKKMSLEQCDDIYKNLGKLVFANVEQNESATWREKLDQIYKSSSQNLRVMVHGSKHSAEEFERLLKEMLGDDDGDLLIDSAVKGGPKVFVVSTLVSVLPAAPFVFRNYQYPPGTPETPLWTSEGPAQTAGTPAAASFLSSQVGPRKAAFVGSCKFHTWEAIRASSAAPYYLDDYSNGNNRWQDGAIVANNPTLIAIREARLLWPDLPIDCVVSLGCGLLPPKVRGKGGWRLADTGQVLVESACSVERVEEAFDTFLPLMPDIKYYRINPIDDRCGMELDETDPAIWKRLEAATADYINLIRPTLDELSLHLMPEPHQQEKMEMFMEMRAPSFRDQLNPTVPESETAEEQEKPTTMLGYRRKVLLVEGRRSPELSKPFRHTRSLETFCLRRGIKVDTIDCNPSQTGVSSRPLKSTSIPVQQPGSPVAGSQTSPSSPLKAGSESHPATPRRGASPEPDLDQLLSPGPPPEGDRWGGALQLAAPAQELLDRLEASPLVGVLHLALHCDRQGFILSWRSDIFAVAEPGELADIFLRQAGAAVRTLRKRPPKSLTDLVKVAPRFLLGGTMHRFMGRHTQVMPDGTEVGAYLFKRTLPAARITADDARWMIGAWRERVIICTGLYAPPPSLIDALLDSGAKLVIAPVKELPPQSSFDGGDSINMLTGDFPEEEKGPDFNEEDPFGNVSNGEDDWDDRSESGFDDENCSSQLDEKDLADFLGTLYAGIYSGGLDAVSALKQALEIHPKQHFQCHFSK